MSAFLKLLGFVLLATYPVLIYFGLAHIKPSVFAMVLLALIAVRQWATQQHSPLSLLPALALGVYCLFVAISDSAALLLYYPVVVSLMVAFLFFKSLFDEQTLIEKFARMAGEEPPSEGLGFLSNLTVIWSVFLLANAGVAAFTACCTAQSTWVLYNGLLSYVAIACLLGGELVVRHFFKKRLEQSL